jgi:hypothetical protein
LLYRHPPHWARRQFVFVFHGFLRRASWAVEEPDNDPGALVVIRVTSSGIERHVQRIDFEPPGVSGMYTLLKGRIYANWPALGGLDCAGGQVITSKKPLRTNKDWMTSTA